MTTASCSCPTAFRRRRSRSCATRPRQIYATDRQEVWREKSGAPRTAFAAHTYNEAFRLLGPHPRLIAPVEQVFGEQLYMHQYKINAKAPSTARSGSGTRITAPGRATTACPSRGR